MLYDAPYFAPLQQMIPTCSDRWTLLPCAGKRRAATNITACNGAGNVTAAICARVSNSAAACTLLRLACVLLLLMLAVKVLAALSCSGTAQAVLLA